MPAFSYTFSKSAAKDIRKLDAATRQRIARKLDFYLSQPDPLVHARPIIDSAIGSYRFRVGHFRVVFDVESDKLIIHNVKHRKDVYKT